MFRSVELCLGVPSKGEVLTRLEMILPITSRSLKLPAVAGKLSTVKPTIVGCQRMSFLCFAPQEFALFTVPSARVRLM